MQLFNPLPLPSDLEAVIVGAAVAKPAARKRHRSRTSRRKLKPQQVSARKLTMAQIKARVQGRLAKLDPAKLKSVLRKCGLSVALVATIVLLAKYAPIVLLLIAAIGLTGLAALYNRMSCGSGLKW